MIENQDTVDETEYLLRSPNNAKYLMESIEQLQSGQVRERGLISIDAEFVPTEEDKYLDDLASKYHRHCETYDRTVCTGPVINGEVQPRDERERKLCIDHALQVRNLLMEQAFRDHGIDGRKVQKAIHNYHSS